MTGKCTDESYMVHVVPVVTIGHCLAVIGAQYKY